MRRMELSVDDFVVFIRCSEPVEEAVGQTWKPSIDPRSKIHSEFWGVCGTSCAGPVGSASPAGAMLRLLRLAS